METLKLNDLTTYKFLSNVQFSPDGGHVCFVVHESDLEENDYRSHLWIYQVEENHHFQLTAFGQESKYIWLHDNIHILFSGTRDPKDTQKLKDGEVFTQFYTISINGGEALKAFRIPEKVTDFRQLDENRYLLAVAYDPHRSDVSGLNEADTAQALKQRREAQDYEVLEEIPFWSNGGGFTSKKRSRLYLYDVHEEKLEALTPETMDVDVFNLNADKTQVILTGSDFEGKRELPNGIYCCNLDTKEFREIAAPEEFWYTNVDYMDAETLICSGSDMQRYGRNENKKFYRIELASGEQTCLTPDLDLALRNSVASDCRYGGGHFPANMKRDGEYLYFVGTEGAYSYLNRIDHEGNIDKVITEHGTVDLYDVHDGVVAFVGFRELYLQELYFYRNIMATQVTAFNQAIQENNTLSTPEKMIVEVAPGVSIEGWVMKPVNFNPRKRYPAILDIHGGPRGVYSDTFFHEMQYWANEGYAVLYCNPRGSDGKGNEFADIRGKYGFEDYEDIMKFTDAVLDTCPFIDADRLGVTGGSYGGYMTNWIIGHTNRFKAAASQRSIANWISKFCTTDIGYYFVEDQNQGTPWENQEKLWLHSPLKYADQVATPTLFIHSEEDYRCWLTEGLQMFTALKYFGVEARLCMFRGENHELSRSGKPKHRIRRLQEITEWFDKYLKG